MKTVQGLNIHKAKMHKDILDENITKRDHIDCSCKKCKFSFANHEELEKHKKNCGTNRLCFECTLCGERFEDSGILERHDKSIHTLKKYKCDYRDIMVEAANGMGAVLSMQKHHDICLCKPKVIVEETRFTCELCGYISISEDTFKRHNRDKHDNPTKSTSPKPKRRRKLSNYRMETDEDRDEQYCRSDG